MRLEGASMLAKVFLFIFVNFISTIKWSFNIIQHLLWCFSEYLTFTCLRPPSKTVPLSFTSPYSSICYLRLPLLYLLSFSLRFWLHFFKKYLIIAVRVKTHYYLLLAWQSICSICFHFCQSLNLCLQTCFVISLESASFF